MRSDVLKGLALGRAEKAIAEGDVDAAWQWLQAVDPQERPAAWVAGCLDAQSRLAASDGDWSAALHLAEQAANAQPSPWLQRRVALLRRRLPSQSDHEWQVIRGKVPPARRLNPMAYAGDVDEVAACGAYHSRGAGSDAPWSRYLRLGKTPPLEEVEQQAIFAIASRFLARFVAQETDFLAKVELVVPVPANPVRHANRMVSLPDEVASGAGDILALPVFPFAVAWRPEATGVEMKRLAWAERRALAATAFTSGSQGDQVAGRSVLLVDDICTSGSTVRACARILRGSGATEVKVCCLAHTEG